MQHAPTLPRLGLGISGALGWPYITPRADALHLIRAAHDAGLRYFDTGHSYCAGEAEVTLGMAVRDIGRDNMFISTKLGTLAVGRLGRVRQDFRHPTLAAALDESLRRLCCEWVDVLMLHSPPTQHLAQGLDFLLEARGRGKARMVGASITQDQAGSPELSRCDVVMLKHSISHPLAQSRIAAIRLHGTKIVAKRALAHDTGLLHALWPRHFRRADIWYALRMLKHRIEGKSGSERGDYTVEDRLRFALSTVDCVVFGSTRIENVCANIQTAGKLVCLT